MRIRRRNKGARKIRIRKWWPGKPGYAESVVEFTWDDGTERGGRGLVLFRFAAPTGIPERDVDALRRRPVTVEVYGCQPYDAVDVRYNGNEIRGTDGPWDGNHRIR